MGHEWLSMPSPVFIEGVGLFVMSINIIEDANKVDKKSVNVYTICMLCMQTASVLQ